MSWSSKLFGLNCCQTSWKKLAGRLRIQLAVDRLTEEKATEICDLLQNHSGGIGVTVELHHEENVLDMISRKQKVELSPELLDTLDGLDGVAYKVIGG